MKINSAISKFFYGFALILVQILSLLLLTVSLICTFFVNYYADDMISQVRLPHTDSSLFHLILAALLLLLIYGILRLYHYRIDRAAQKVFPPAALVMILLGGILILLGKTLPAADSASVYAIGEAFARSDYGAIHPTDSYLSFYPQQIGLVSMYDILLRLYHLLPLPVSAVVFLKCFNLLFALMILYFLYKICQVCFRSSSADLCCILLTVMNLPLIFYISFVYSELPSFAFLTAGIYFLLLYLQSNFTGGDFYKLCSLLFLTLSVLLRKNSLVVIIAVLLVLILECFYKKRPHYLLYGIILTFCVLAVLPAVQKIYEVKAGNTLKSGVTATSYFAMGMQEGPRGCGWYNGFNFNTYLEAEMDSERANEISKAAIQERLAAFRQNPGVGIHFYKEKYLSQWTDGSYFCREATMASYGERPALLQSLYDGRLSKILMHYCNAYQLLLYLGAAFGILSGLVSTDELGKKSKNLSAYLCMIGVLGGFFFHMIWEANSRYLFLYSLLLIPYSAKGISRILQKRTSS